MKKHLNEPRPTEPRLTAKTCWLKLYRRAGHFILRVMPGMAAVLVLSTLVLYLTVGPGAVVQVRSASGAETALDTDRGLSFAEDDFLDLRMNRSKNYLTGAAQTTAAAETSGAATETTTAVPTVQPDPTSAVTPEPTAYPRVFDASGIPQEGMPVADFTADNTLFYVKVNQANIRELPNTASAIVTEVLMGDKVTRLGYGIDWSKVKTASGKTGYILTRFITTEAVSKPTPTPTARPTAKPTPFPTGSATSGLTDAQKQAIIDLAKSCLGVRYVYGGESMSGFDCSGFTTYIYKTLFNITLPRSARSQATAGVGVSRANIQVGDIICFDWDHNDGICDHVGLYIGGGQYIHAAHSKGYVLQSTLKSTNPVVSIRRIIR